MMDDENDAEDASRSRKPATRRMIRREIGIGSGAPIDMKAVTAQSLTATQFLKSVDAGSLREMHRTLALKENEFSALQDQLRDQLGLTAQLKESLGKLASARQTWTEVLKQAVMPQEEFNALTKQLLDQSRLPQLATLSDSLRNLSGIGDAMSSLAVGGSVDIYMKEVARDFHRSYAEVGGIGKSLSDAIKEATRSRLDWQEAMGRSMAGATVASMLAAAPLGVLSKTVVEISALTATMMNANPDRELWEKARRASVIIDNIVALQDIEASSPESADDVKKLFERLEDRIVAAVAKASRPSQQMALAQTIFALLALFVAVLTLMQAEMHHAEDSRKHDYGPDMLQEMTRQTELLRDLREGLEERSAHVDKVVVLRNAHLREAPTTSAKSTRILKTGDMAHFLETANGWTGIEIADPLTGEIEVGWVYSRLVARIDREAQ